MQFNRDISNCVDVELNMFNTLPLTVLCSTNTILERIEKRKMKVNTGTENSVKRRVTYSL